MSLKIKNQKGDIEMDFCCETMDNRLSSGVQFILDNINGMSGVWLRRVSGFMSPDRLIYCPYCGERFNITKEPDDELSKTPSKPTHPRFWDDKTDNL
jgi:hypothetical protein